MWERVYCISWLEKECMGRMLLDIGPSLSCHLSVLKLDSF